MRNPPRDPFRRRAEALLGRRRARLAKLLHNRLDPPRASRTLSDARRAFLCEEAEELYWNELAWEKLTEDEGLGGRGLVEYTFPGFLAFIEGLLLREVMPDSVAPAAPHPEVVEEILLFLCRRCAELRDEEAEDAGLERQVTLRLIDLVLYRLHDVPVEELDRLETSAADEDE